MVMGRLRVRNLRYIQTIITVRSLHTFLTGRDFHAFVNSYRTVFKWKFSKFRHSFVILRFKILKRKLL